MATFGSTIEYQKPTKSSNAFNYVAITFALILAGVSITFSILKILEEPTDNGGGGGGGTFPSVTASSVTVKDSLKTPRLNCNSFYNSNIYDLKVNSSSFNSEYDGLRTTIDSDINVNGRFESFDGSTIFTAENNTITVKKMKSNTTVASISNVNFVNTGAQMLIIDKNISFNETYIIKITISKISGAIAFRIKNGLEPIFTVYSAPSLIHILANVITANNAYLLISVIIEMDSSITINDTDLLNGLKMTIIPFSNNNYTTVKFEFSIISTFLFRAQGVYSLYYKTDRGGLLRNQLTNTLKITPDINSAFYDRNFNFAYGTLNLLFIKDTKSLDKDNINIIFYNKNSLDI